MGTLDQATHLVVEAEPRYWEDATVNGVDDEDGTLIPGRVGALWTVRIELATGVFVGWPNGTTAELHYKVCDAGQYWLSDQDGRRVAKWRGAYVPSRFLCHGGEGYGDYIILTVDHTGRIENYDPPVIHPEDWETL